MVERIKKPLWAKIPVQASQSCPDYAGVALIEGLPPLARIALTARIARRARRFFPFRVESARLVVDSAIRAAEKAASGEALTAEEDLAASDATVRQACELEQQQGDTAAAEAGRVARMAARCVYGPEIAYGESALLAAFHLQSTVARFGRAAGNGLIHPRITLEELALKNDLNRLILITEKSADRCINPSAKRLLKERNDRGWARMLEKAGVPSGGAGKNRERWERIHEAVKRAGGRFYPQAVFDPI